MKYKQKKILFLNPDDIEFGKIIIFEFKEVRNHNGIFRWHALYNNYLFLWSDYNLRQLIKNGDAVEITERNKDKYNKLLSFF